MKLRERYNTNKTTETGKRMCSHRFPWFGSVWSVHQHEQEKKHLNKSCAPDAHPLWADRSRGATRATPCMLFYDAAQISYQSRYSWVTGSPKCHRKYCRRMALVLCLVLRQQKMIRNNRAVLTDMGFLVENRKRSPVHF